jgi:hypothetical protein
LSTIEWISAVPKPSVPTLEELTPISVQVSTWPPAGTATVNVFGSSTAVSTRLTTALSIANSKAAPDGRMVEYENATLPAVTKRPAYYRTERDPYPEMSFLAIIWNGEHGLPVHVEVNELGIASNEGNDIPAPTEYDPAGHCAQLFEESAYCPGSQIAVLVQFTNSSTFSGSGTPS